LKKLLIQSKASLCGRPRKDKDPTPKVILC